MGEQRRDYREAHGGSSEGFVARLPILGLEVPQAGDGVLTNKNLFNMHKSFGICLLALALLRLGLRLADAPPPYPETMPRWEKLAARLSHWALYIFMIGVPLMGWLTISRQRSLPSYWFLSDTQIPKLPVTDSMQQWNFGEAHEVLAWSLAMLLALHVAAALKHHILDRDAVLTHMIPMLKQRRPKPLE
jgi:cytochrome b561